LIPDPVNGEFYLDTEHQEEEWRFLVNEFYS
jgi:hypothetical protein